MTKVIIHYHIVDILMDTNFMFNKSTYVSET